VVKSLSGFFLNPEQVLQELGYNKNTRAEEITVEDYIRLMQKNILYTNLKVTS
jgi:16S rRNA A1518/A1519 N6-dimethyltransferase RsmA/KsgA/DIM1 with predicted DNA glycosylase/AP lyase activity